MKVEYLLIKSNNDFCKTIEQFKSLLRSNCQLKFDGNNIIFSNAKLSYSLTQSDIEWGKKKESVFYFSVLVDADSFDVEECSNKDIDDISDYLARTLESFNMLLHRINENCGNHFMINIVWDDVSMFYAQKLYPQIIETESLLRKVIYRFMIKIAGSSWFGDTVPDNVKEAIAKTAQRNNMEAIPQENQLYLADFIQLGWFFFEKYTTKPFGQDVITKLKMSLDDEDYKNQINRLIEIYEAKSNWDRYFAEKINIDGLYEKWQQLYNYRNKVAHAKGINSNEYEHAKKLIDELREAFLLCLNHIDDVDITEDEVEAVQKVAEETISNIQPKINANSDAWITRYPGLTATASQLGIVASKIGSQIDSAGLNSMILQISNQPLYYTSKGILGSDIILDNMIGTSGRINPCLDIDNLVVKPKGTDIRMKSLFSPSGESYIYPSSQSTLLKVNEAGNIVACAKDDSENSAVEVDSSRESEKKE